MTEKVSNRVVFERCQRNSVVDTVNWLVRNESSTTTSQYFTSYKRSLERLVKKHGDMRKNMYRDPKPMEQWLSETYSPPKPAVNRTSHTREVTQLLKATPDALKAESLGKIRTVLEEDLSKIKSNLKDREQKLKLVTNDVQKQENINKHLLDVAKEKQKAMKRMRSMITYKDSKIAKLEKSVVTAAVTSTSESSQSDIDCDCTNKIQVLENQLEEMRENNNSVIETFDSKSNKFVHNMRKCVHTLLNHGTSDLGCFGTGTENSISAAMSQDSGQYEHLATFTCSSADCRLCSSQAGDFFEYR